MYAYDIPRFDWFIYISEKGVSFQKGREFQ